MALIETISGAEQKQWAITNVLLNDQIVSIVILGSKVSKVISGRQAWANADLRRIETMNGDELIAIPALVGPHCHSRVMGEEHKEDQHTVVLAAEYGGVQIIGDMPNNKKPIITIEALEEKIQIFRGCRNVDVRFWFGATPNNQTEFGSLMPHYRHQVLGLKQYDGSSTGSLLVAKEQDQRKNCEYAAINNLILARHAEDEAMMVERYGRIEAARGGKVLVSDHCQIRDTEVEVSAVRRALRQNKDIGGKLYLCHLSAPESVELAYDAKQAGQEVYVEVCIHHLFFNDSFLNGDKGPFFKMNPALRTAKQVLRLRELVCLPDYVDVIADDHAPHLVAEKKSGQYGTTPSGVTGLETTFSALWSLVNYGQMTIDRFISLTSRRAAEIFNLDAGVIQADSPANFVLVDPNKEVRWDNSMIHSKCAWTPFHGYVFNADIKYTIHQGTCKRIVRDAVV